jgi:hypothetical protein
MKQPYSLNLLVFLVGILPAFGQVDPLKTVPGFAPTFKLNESITESVETTVDTKIGGFGEYDPVTRQQLTSDSSSISITANISGVSLASIQPETPFAVKVGRLSFTGILGQDPSYTEANKATRRSIVISKKVVVDEDHTIGGYSVKLSWTATRLIIDITGSRSFKSLVAEELMEELLDPAAAASYAGNAEVGTTKSIKNVISVSVQFAEFASAPRDALLQATSSVKKEIFGSKDDVDFEEFLLDTVEITGGFDLALPSATITAPAKKSSPRGKFTLTGKASDAHGISAID